MLDFCDEVAPELSGSQLLYSGLHPGFPVALPVRVAHPLGERVTCIKLQRSGTGSTYLKDPVGPKVEGAQFPWLLPGFDLVDRPFCRFPECFHVPPRWGLLQSRLFFVKGSDRRSFQPREQFLQNLVDR